LQPVNAEEVSGRWRAGDGAFWVDLDSYEVAQLKEWLDALDLPRFIKERCLDIGKSTQMVLLPEYAFLEITVFSDDELSSLTNVGMLCLKNLLITLHPEPIHNLEKVHRSIDELKLKDISTSGLLNILLLIQANEAAAAARGLATPGTQFIRPRKSDHTNHRTAISSIFWSESIRTSGNHERRSSTSHKVCSMIIFRQPTSDWRLRGSTADKRQTAMVRPCSHRSLTG
jgi:hypothetical protein